MLVVVRWCWFFKCFFNGITTSVNVAINNNKSNNLYPPYKTTHTRFRKRQSAKARIELTAACGKWYCMDLYISVDLYVKSDTSKTEYRLNVPKRINIYSFSLTLAHIYYWLSAERRLALNQWISIGICLFGYGWPVLKGNFFKQNPKWYNVF